MVSVRLCEGQSSDRRERPALTFCPWWCLVYDVISKASWLFIHFSLFYLVLFLYTTTHKFGVSKKVILLFNKDTLNWSKGSKDIYNVTKYLYKKWMLFFWIFYSATKNPALHKKILRSTTVSNQHTRMISEGKFSFASGIFHNITAFTGLLLSNKCSEHKILSKHLNKLTDL